MNFHDNSFSGSISMKKPDEDAIELRLYQREVLDRAMWLLGSGKRVLMQMPTGSGKTITAGRLIQLASANSNVWFVCHRREIIRQASRTLAGFGIDHGIIAQGAEREYDKPVQVASVQTLNFRRQHNIPAPDVIVWDEAHHIVAKTWLRIMNMFPEAKHIGLTATPERLDGRGLDEVFDEIVLGPSIQWLIDNGHLSNYKMFVPSEPDLTAARVAQGDYHKGDLDKIMNTPVLIGDALDHYQRIAPGSRALAFAASVAHSKALVEKFNSSGIPAAHVDGKTPDTVRDAAIVDLEAGRIKLLSNFGVFGEGFDLPAIDCVILLRPTKSLQMYLQMVGRGLRASDGKDSAVLLDHSGLFHSFGTPAYDWDWKLGGGALKRRRAAALANREYTRHCPECSHAHPIASECPECGFEYPTGWDIGEFDGILFEHIQGHAERAVPLVEYARSIGVRPKSLYGLVRYGFPTTMGRNFVDPSEANEWLRENPPKKLPPIFEKNREEFESGAAFARRVGTHTSTIHSLVKKGKLTAAANGWVNYRLAVQEYCIWKESAERKISDESLSTISAFSRETGIGPSVINRLIDEGLPTHKGKILVIAARDWLVGKNLGDRMPPHDVDNPSEYISRSELAKRAGVSSRVIRKLVSLGMPCATNGWVHEETGLRWVHDKWLGRNLSERPPRDVLAPDEYESGTSFARRHGISQTLVRHLRKKGLPSAQNGWVHSSDGDIWMASYSGKRMAPPEDRAAKYHEPVAAFSRRIGYSSSYTVSKLLKQGLPSASNGWVNIRAGLDWIRDNTNIEIPPEAWPKEDE